jgi:hypothetical protein
MANAVVLSRCAAIPRSRGIHFTIPPKCIGIHHAIVRDVPKWPAIHLARHSQQVL